MCHHLTILAYTGDHRVVAQCEHGIVHLGWDITTIRLRLRDFLTLAQFVERWGARNEPLLCEGWCQMTRNSHGAARLWIGQVGLAIAAADVALFVALVQQAASVLVAAATWSGAGQRAALGCATLAVDPLTLPKN